MTPEARAARERKQKIFVVVGGIFLLAMLAFQLPKLLGGSGGTEAAATTPAQPAQSDTPTPATPVVLTGAQPGASIGPGKLRSFGAFKPKDPFVQLVSVEPAPTGDASAGGGGAGEKGQPEGGSKGFSIDGSKAGPAVTIVSVNGVRQTLEPGVKFPASDPVFVLVAEQPGSKSVVVGVAGGAYAGGSKTTKLKVGKPLTLVNTATGAKYTIKLVSVGSGDSSPSEPAPAR